MKKYYIPFFLFVFCVSSLNAQNLSTIVFVDKDGHQVADGSTITVNTAVENDFGEMVLHSGLYVKNLKTDNVGVRVHFNVRTLDNGLFQICFPVACITKSVTGVFETGSDIMAASEQRDLQSEWTPQTYGKCIVTYQIELMNQLSGFPPQSEPQEMLIRPALTPPIRRVRQMLLLFIVPTVASSSHHSMDLTLFA